MNWIKSAIILVATVIAVQPAMAQAGPDDIIFIDAPAEPDAIPLYGDATMGSAEGETWMQYMGKWPVVRNVTYPTLTPFLPDPEKATGAAVVIAPGGAFMLLAIDPEGWKVAQALADRGIAAFVLKYRIMPTPVGIAESNVFMNEEVAKGLTDPTKQPTLQYPPSTDDGFAALAMVRANAEQWGVDPNRVGMMGFSAGAMTTLNVITGTKGDEGPNFAGYIYGPQAAVEVPANAPPLFVAIAMDDPLFPNIGFPVVQGWHAAGRPVELHAYGKGGHGFNLGIEGTTTTLILDQFVAWLGMEGFLKPAAPAPTPLSE
jgi:acetyl esterase/lipase